MVSAADRPAPTRSSCPARPRRRACGRCGAPVGGAARSCRTRCASFADALARPPRASSRWWRRGSRRRRASRWRSRRARGPGCRSWSPGTGPCARRGRRVRFVGRVSGDELAALRARAALAIVPSRSAETFGLAAAEAMAAGVPVVASRVGALAELVDPGGLVAPGDVGALAERARARASATPRPGAAGLARVRARCATRRRWLSACPGSTRSIAAHARTRDRRRRLHRLQPRRRPARPRRRGRRPRRPLHRASARTSPRRSAAARRSSRATSATRAQRRGDLRRRAARRRLPPRRADRRPRVGRRPRLDAAINVVRHDQRARGGARARAPAASCNTSTGGAIYGEADAIPTPESAPPRPMAPYGQSKFCAEALLRAATRACTGCRPSRCATPTSTARARTRTARPA